MSIHICPNCNQRYVVSPNCSDYVHNCNSGNKAIDEEDVVVMGSWTDDNGEIIKYNDFDGVDDYVEIPHHSSQLGVNLVNGFTISAWINPRGMGGGNVGRVIDKSNAEIAGFELRVATNNAFRAGINGVTRTSADNSIPYGVWTHICFTANAVGDVLTYANGAVSGVGGTTAAVTLITTTNAIRIGNRSGATDRTFDGSIKDIKMWNRVLTESEIMQDYAGGLIINQGLIYYFKLGGDYKNYGQINVTSTNSGSVVLTTNTSTHRNVPPQQVLMQGAENTLFGTRADIEGDNLDEHTRRGLRASSHRQRNKMQYIDLKNEK